MPSAPPLNVAVAPRLAHPPAEILRAFYLLIPAAGLTMAPAGVWPVWTNILLDMPNQLITISNTTPLKGSKSQTTGEVFDRYGVQVRIRSHDPNVGAAKADAIVALTDKIARFELTLGAVMYRIGSAHRPGGLLSLGLEPNKGRYNWTVNYLLSIDQL